MESRKVPALKPPVIGFPSQLCSGVVRVESGAGRLAHAKPRNHCSKNIIDHLSEAKSRIRARHSSLAKFAGREGVKAQSSSSCLPGRTDVGGVDGIYRGLLCLLEHSVTLHSTAYRLVTECLNILAPVWFSQCRTSSSPGARLSLGIRLQLRDGPSFWMSQRGAESTSGR